MIHHLTISSPLTLEYLNLNFVICQWNQFLFVTRVSRVDIMRTGIKTHFVSEAVCNITYIIGVLQHPLPISYTISPPADSLLPLLCLLMSSSFSFVCSDKDSCGNDSAMPVEYQLSSRQHRADTRRGQTTIPIMGQIKSPPHHCSIDQYDLQPWLCVSVLDDFISIVITVTSAEKMFFGNTTLLLPLSPLTPSQSFFG